MKSNKYIPILLGVVLCLCPLARSNITNGGFEAGSPLGVGILDLPGWSAVGADPYLVGGPAAVTEEYARDFLGLPQAPASGLWGPTEGDFFASLWSTDSLGTDASSLSQTFEALAGDTLTFDYFYDFGDYTPDDDPPGAYDPAKIYVIDSFFDVFFEVEINYPGSELGSDENIDWTSVSVLLPNEGEYTLAFEIEDGCGFFESYLGVDNVNVAPIPAPGAILLGSIGMGLVGLLRRRRVL